MYHIYRGKSFTWRNQHVQARLITEPSRERIPHIDCGFGFKSLIQNEPYGVDLELTYQVNSKHPHPDSYFETHSFNLYSERLINLMGKWGVKFESFPVMMVDQNGQELSDLSYYIFHSLEGIIDAMDEDASEWQGDNINIGIPQLVLDYNKFEHRPLFICDKIFIPLMHDDLKKEISCHEITGFSFLSLEKFRSGTYGFVANYND